MNNIAVAEPSKTLATDLAWTCLGVLLLFATSQISIPIQPVPITLQTAGVMLIGLTFSRRSALSAVAFYLMIGACGVPVFSEFLAGPSVFLLPSGGYLIGFFFAVLAMTLFKPKKIGGLFLNCLLGTGIIFIFGISWLSIHVGFHNALLFGLVPFIIPGAVKAGLLTLGVRYLRSKKC